MPTIVPQEIVDEIIDAAFVRSGKLKKSLSSFALCSHACSSRARLHLFNNISFERPPSCPAKHVREWAEFHSIVARSPEVQRAVRTVSVGDFGFFPKSQRGATYTCIFHNDPI